MRETELIRRIAEADQNKHEFMEPRNFKPFITVNIKTGEVTYHKEKKWVKRTDNNAYGNKRGVNPSSPLHIEPVG